MDRAPPGGASTVAYARQPSACFGATGNLNGPSRAATRRARPGSRKVRGQSGVSGLESAIILIAFVVVASVFAFAMLDTGIFAAGEGKAAAYAGLDQAAGTLQLRGSVRAVRGDVDVDGDNTINLNGSDKQAVTKVIFTVTGALGGSVIDLTPPYTTNDTGTDPDASGLNARATVSIQTDNLFVNDAAWTVTFPGSDNGDYLLDNSERAEITVWLNTYDNVNTLYDLGAGSSDPYVDASTDLLQTDKEFTIQLRPDKGSTLNIQRTTPAVLRPQMDLR